MISMLYIRNQKYITNGYQFFPINNRKRGGSPAVEAL
jgi:hypothetical protein